MSNCVQMYFCVYKPSVSNRGFFCLNQNVQDSFTISEGNCDSLSGIKWGEELADGVF